MDPLEDNFAIRHLSSFPYLPVYKPADHAHIIDLATVNNYTPGVPGHDALVTFLFNYDPNFLEKFLDTSINHISFNRYTERDISNHQCGNVWIERYSDHIICGYYELVNGERVFDAGMQYLMKDSGEWKLLATLGEFRSKKPSTAEAGSFGLIFLLHRKWKYQDGVVMEVQYEANENDAGGYDVQFESVLRATKKVSDTDDSPEGQITGDAIPKKHTAGTY